MYHSELELTKSCSKFSSDTVQFILSSLLSLLARQKGIERNLLIKKFIKDIIYSKNQIQINLYYSTNFTPRNLNTDLTSAEFFHMIMDDVELQCIGMFWHHKLGGLKDMPDKEEKLMIVKEVAEYLQLDE